MRAFRVTAFEWDTGNRTKNVLKHGVRNEEAEEAFFDPKAKIRKTHTGRYVHLGVTDSGRHLFQVFELVDSCTVRIISSRPMDRDELRLYRGKRGGGA